MAVAMVTSAVASTVHRTAGDKDRAGWFRSAACGGSKQREQRARCRSSKKRLRISGNLHGLLYYLSCFKEIRARRSRRARRR